MNYLWATKLLYNFLLVKPNLYIKQALNNEIFVIFEVWNFIYQNLESWLVTYCGCGTINYGSYFLYFQPSLHFLNIYLILIHLIDHLIL